MKTLYESLLGNTNGSMVDDINDFLTKKHISLHLEKDGDKYICYYGYKNHPSNKVYSNELHILFDEFHISPKDITFVCSDKSQSKQLSFVVQQYNNNKLIFKNEIQLIRSLKFDKPFFEVVLTNPDTNINMRNIKSFPYMCFCIPTSRETLTTINNIEYEEDVTTVIRHVKKLLFKNCIANECQIECDSSVDYLDVKANNSYINSLVLISNDNDTTLYKFIINNIYPELAKEYDKSANKKDLYDFFIEYCQSTGKDTWKGLLDNQILNEFLDCLPKSAVDNFKKQFGVVYIDDYEHEICITIKNNKLVSPLYTYYQKPLYTYNNK